MSPERSRPVKLALTRERILDNALAFADQHGLAELSMRKLADHLGVGTMSLYNHVASKDDMITGMVDLVVADIEHPTGDDWRSAVRASAASAHLVLLRHHWVAPEWSRRSAGPARRAYMEALLATLTGAGLSETLVYHGYHAITMHIVGFTIQELGYLDAPAEMALDSLTEDFLTELVDAGFPHLATHARAHVAASGHGDEFGFVLDLILDGLEGAR